MRISSEVCVIYSSIMKFIVYIQSIYTVVSTIFPRVFVLSYCYPTAILLLSYGMTCRRIAKYSETVSAM